MIVKVISGSEFQKPRDGDNGYDLYVKEGSEDIVLEPFQTAVIDTGTKISMQQGMCALVIGRSSVSKRGIITSVGLVDNSYQGSIGVTVTNLSGEAVTFVSNQKIAQLLFIKPEMPYIHAVDYFEEKTERGENGWGSTGNF